MGRYFTTYRGTHNNEGSIFDEKLLRFLGNYLTYAILSYPQQHDEIFLYEMMHVDYK